MTRAPGWIVAIAAGSLLGGPVLGLLAGGLAELAGASSRVALNVSLLVALLAVWAGQAVAFGAYWARRPERWLTDRVLIVTGTLTLLCPALLVMLAAAWAL